MALTKCKECGSEVSTTAKTCPKCGAAVKKQTSKATWVVAAFLLMAFIGSQLSNKEEKSNAENASATEVSAADLYAEYHTNEIDADSRYKGQRLKVSGVLNGIKKGIGDEAYLQLKTANQFMPVRASLRSSAVSTASSLSPGNKVTVNCKGTGMLLGSPTLDDCVLQ